MKVFTDPVNKIPPLLESDINTDILPGLKAPGVLLLAGFKPEQL